MLGKAKTFGFGFSTYSGAGEMSTTNFQSSARDIQKERPPYDEPKTLKKNVQMADAKSHGKQN